MKAPGFTGGLLLFYPLNKMPIIQINNQSILYMHIPKTGGTTVEAIFKKQGGKRLLFNSKPSVDDFYFPCSPQHFHLTLVKQLCPLDVFDYRFTIVRNPFSRLASEYRNRQRRKYLQGKPIPDFNNWVNDIFIKYTENPWVNDNHIRPQKEFAGDGFDIFRFEDGIENIVNLMRERFKLSPMKDLPHRQKSVSIPITLDSDTAEKIIEFYKNDFSVFNYSTETASIL